HTHTHTHTPLYHTHTLLYHIHTPLYHTHTHLSTTCPVFHLCKYTHIYPNSPVQIHTHVPYFTCANKHTEVCRQQNISSFVHVSECYCKTAAVTCTDDTDGAEQLMP